jgi:cytochrome c oxidase assembly protein subunit 11
MGAWADHGKRRNVLTVAGLVVILAAMTGLVAESVPLYRLFCRVTGYGGTTNVATVAPAVAGDRKMTIRFNADVNSRLPWSFKPAQREVVVKLGEQKLAYFEAVNIGDEPIVGTATFNVTPAKAGYYFDKIECFCFTEQRLEPGERAEMPVSFFVDPDLAKDPGLDDVTTITLSYTFFRSPSDRADSAGVETATDRRVAAAQ